MAWKGDGRIISNDESGSSEERIEEGIPSEDGSTLSLPETLTTLSRAHEFSAFFLQKSGEHFHIYALTMDASSKMDYYEVGKPIELPLSPQKDSQFVLDRDALHVLSDFTLHTFELVNGEIDKRAIRRQFGSNEEGQRMLKLGCYGLNIYVQSELCVHEVPYTWIRFFYESLGDSGKFFGASGELSWDYTHAVWCPELRTVAFCYGKSNPNVDTHGAHVLDVSREYIVLGGETPTLIKYRGRVEERKPLQFGRDIYQAEIMGPYILVPAERQNESQSIIDLYHVPSDKYYSTPVPWNSESSILQVSERNYLI